jgi:hypothetical protein
MRDACKQTNKQTLKITRWYHSGLLRGRGPKKFVKKVSRNDVGVITNELGPFKITRWYHSVVLCRNDFCTQFWLEIVWKTTQFYPPVSL